MSKLREKYSGGHVASVYTLSEKDKLRFPRADLVREDSVADFSWFARLYYKQKIASLLYPDNFIEVVGAGVEPLVPVGRRQSERIQKHNLFSKQAAVKIDHAVFSSHLRLTTKGGKLYKESTCPCAHCVQHTQEHLTQNMETIARKASELISPSGIVPSADDPSDYCITDRGIIFFELQSFDPNQIKKTINSSETTAPAQQTALSLLDRYLVLETRTRLEAMRGKPIGLRLTS